VDGCGFVWHKFLLLQIALHHNAAMQRNLSPHWPARACAFGFSALAAASLVFWGIKIFADVTSPPAGPLKQGSVKQVDSAMVARALGASSATSGSGTAAVPFSDTVRNRFVLTGVVADVNQRGVALISVDGKPAKRISVGTPVTDEWVLEAVQNRRATLSPISANARDQSADAANTKAFMMLEMNNTKVSGQK
jgi:general secretion pathway protein C